jgi:hypothetical protein
MISLLLHVPISDIRVAGHSTYISGGTISTDDEECIHIRYKNNVGVFCKEKEAWLTLIQPIDYLIDYELVRNCPDG